MQVQFKDKEKYLKDEIGNRDDFEMGWLMKEYDDEKHGNSVYLYALDKGAVCINSIGTLATVALRSCYVVEYTFNGSSNTVVFTDDDLEGAIDYTLKLIALAKA